MKILNMNKIKKRWIILILVLMLIFVIASFIFIISGNSILNNKTYLSANNNYGDGTKLLDKKLLDNVEIAKTEEEIERGLMYRKELCNTCGMLFDFPFSANQSFWMKNTFIPLDIIFIDANYTVINIAENTTPFSLDNINSESPAKYVLEVNAYWSKKNNLNKGDKLDINAYLLENKPFVIVPSGVD